MRPLAQASLVSSVPRASRLSTLVSTRILGALYGRTPDPRTGSLKSPVV
jgi:hypothetical protein